MKHLKVVGPYCPVCGEIMNLSGASTSTITVYECPDPECGHEIQQKRQAYQRLQPSIYRSGYTPNDAA